MRDLGCRHIITSLIEHHAVTHTVEYLCHSNAVRVSYVNLLPNGHIDMQHLEKLLSSSPDKTLVSLMHANNEIGNMLDIMAVGNLCKNIRPFFTAIPFRLSGIFR